MFIALWIVIHHNNFQRAMGLRQHAVDGACQQFTAAKGGYDDADGDTHSLILPVGGEYIRPD
ncbi:hypothetical protein D3C71_2224420 [compost metagenome]